MTSEWLTTELLKRQQGSRCPRGNLLCFLWHLSGCLIPQLSTSFLHIVRHSLSQHLVASNGTDRINDLVGCKRMDCDPHFCTTCRLHQLVVCTSHRLPVSYAICICRVAKPFFFSSLLISLNQIHICPAICFIDVNN